MLSRPVTPVPDSTLSRLAPRAALSSTATALPITGSGAMAAGDLCLPRSRRIPSSRPRVPRPRKTELSGRYLAARVAYALVSGARFTAPRFSRGGCPAALHVDRESVVAGKGGAVRVDLGGRRG